MAISRGGGSYEMVPTAGAAGRDALSPMHDDSDDSLAEMGNSGRDRGLGVERERERKTKSEIVLGTSSYIAHSGGTPSRSRIKGHGLIKEDLGYSITPSSPTVIFGGPTGARERRGSSMDS